MAAQVDATQVQEIPISKIDVHRLNPREQKFSGEEFDGLVESVRSQGVLQPVMAVRDNGGFALVDGSRRLAAARAAGRTTVPAIVQESFTDEQVAEVALTANLQREDLTPLEEARAYKGWLDLTKKPQAELAKRVGKAPSTIANALRLLAAPAPIIKALESGTIGGAHGKVLLELEDPSLFEKVKLKKGTTVRDVQDQVVRLNRIWRNAGGPAIAAAKAFLEEARAKHPKATITWSTERGRDGVLNLVDALGKPAALVLGQVHNAKIHDKACACRAYEIDTLTQYVSGFDDDNGYDEAFELKGFELKRACVDDDGWGRYQRAENRGRTTYDGGSAKPRKRSDADIAKDRARNQRAQRDRIARYVTGSGGYAGDGQKPGPDVFKKLTAGGYAGDKAARLVLLAMATEHVYTSSDMPQIVRGVLAMPANKVRDLVLERAAARVNSHAIAHAADQAPYDRQLARYELLTGFGVKATEPKKKQRAKAKKAKR